jgi:hypothetical protein
MTVIQVIQAMGVTALMVAVALGIPVAAYQSLRQTPRRFVLWPVFFAGGAGALAVVLDVAARVVTYFVTRP